MVTVNTTMYFSEKDYEEKYLPNKEAVLKHMRDSVRKFLGIKTRSEKNSSSKQTIKSNNNKNNNKIKNKVSK